MKVLAILRHQQDHFKEAPLQLIAEYFENKGYEVVFPNNENDLLMMLNYNSRVGGILFDWDTYSLDFCKKISAVNELLPLHAFANKQQALDIRLIDLDLNLSFFEYRIDTYQDIAAKIELAHDDYKTKLIPPFTTALFNWVKDYKYTYCTPGHMGGTAFQRSPVGTIFYDFYGANVFKSDVSVSMPELGSLLDHTGPHKEAEEYLARVFGADNTYIVTNGTSTSNKITGMFAAPAGSTVLVDRNCHKSLTHLLMMTDIKPIYFQPTRNAYGILGGIPKQEFTREVIEEKVSRTEGAEWPCYAVITNSTYDGLLYNTDYIKSTLDVKYIHFDSAWVPYTNFHPIYKGLYGMSGEARPDKTIFETQSTHKLLAAFSQASMIHIQGNVDKATFNEVFMMHTSTSPQYAIVASTEVAGAMMDGNLGAKLLDEAVQRSLRFRKEIKQLKAESDSWFYDVWQPETIGEAQCWPLQPHQSWHGFKNIDEKHMHLDPIKVTLLLPGLHEDGQLDQKGIPASLVAKYLDKKGIVVEKTGPYSMLFLFSIGVDRSKSMQLLRALTDFKAAYDDNLLIKDAIPALYAEAPDFYESKTLQDVAQGIHQLIVKHDLPDMMYQAFDVLPTMHMTPYQAFQEVLAGNTEEIYLEDMIGSINANMILPYPPGVPLVLPGEVVSEQSRPVLEFLTMLVEIGRHFPGFETDIHGAYGQKDGRYTINIIKEN